MAKVMLNNLEALARERLADDGLEFSLRAIASQTGLNRRTVTAYVRNQIQRPDSRVVEVFCEWLGCTPHEFWQDEFGDASPEIEALPQAV